MTDTLPVLYKLIICKTEENEICNVTRKCTFGMKKKLLKSFEWNLPNIEIKAHYIIYIYTVFT